jgi:hypothetical protein
MKLKGLLVCAQKLEMKGKELAAVEKVYVANGAVRLADLALKFSWGAPDNDWSSLRRRLNKKFKSYGWHFYRQKNRACVKFIHPKRTSRK